MSESDSAAGLDQATIDARAKLLAFRNSLTDVPTLVGAENVRDAGPFEPMAYRVVSRIETSANGGAGASGSPQAVVAWPLKTPLTTFGEPLGEGLADMRCGTVDGAAGRR